MHDLRHLHSTTLMREGVNPKIVRERAGHAGVPFTLERYSRVTPDMQEIAVEALARLPAQTREEAIGDAATGMLPDPRPAAQRASGTA